MGRVGTTLPGPEDGVASGIDCETGEVTAAAVGTLVIEAEGAVCEAAATEGAVCAAAGAARSVATFNARLVLDPFASPFGGVGGLDAPGTPPD